MARNSYSNEIIEQPLDCAIKKMVTTFYENVDFSLAPQQAMRPGGLKLTKEVLKIAEVQPGWRVLDIACGAGVTLMTLIKDFKCQAYGLDLSAKILEKAKAKLYEYRYRHLTELIRADSEFVPIRQGFFDAVICECSLSLFPNKSKALSEMVNVVRNEGKVIITDVTIKDESAKDAGGAAAWCMCIAGAETLEGYIKLMEGAGLKIMYYKDASEVYDWKTADPELRTALQGKIGYAVVIGVKQ